MNWLHELQKKIESGCEHYEKSAPTVERWLDDLYIRIGQSPECVLLSELALVDRLAGLPGEGWMQPNYAANQVYHLIHRLGRDTTGHAGF